MQFPTREITEKRETSLPEKNVKTVNLKHNFIVICLGNLNSLIFNLYNLSYRNYQSICNYIHKCTIFKIVKKYLSYNLDKIIIKKKF